MNDEAASLISRLGLAPLPEEGGFFATTWRGAPRGPDGRACGSSILFLITPGDFSALHRLRTDEIWHYHAGDPAELVRLDPATGALEVAVLGPDVAGDHVPQSVARAGVWQGCRIQPSAASRGWTLFGCTLAPAWDPEEFELGDRDALAAAFPGHRAWVVALTRLP